MLPASANSLLLITTTLCLCHLPLITFCLDNGLARTPPMGWMSWAEFYCGIDCTLHPFTCISEKLYMDMADRLDEDGYSAVGYKGVHIDDCWMAMERDKATGRLTANATRFPSGIAALARYMHSKGLTLGIYEDYGTKTCGGYPGSYGHLKTDADTFAEWKVDYLKLDGCYVNTSEMATGYPQMSGFLNKTGRGIVYSCSWPAYLIDHPEMVDYRVIGKYCNLWRNYDDVVASWRSIQGIINYYDHNQDKLIKAHGPGHWNDPDMLVIGQPTVTPDQARAQMSIWSIWSAPLIMSNDLRTIAPVYRDILQNQLVIAIDQDPLGIMGRLVANDSDVGVYVKKITPVDYDQNQFSYAVVLLNRNLQRPAHASVQLSKIGLTNPTGYFVQDLWSGQKLGLMKPGDTHSVTVPPTGAAMIKAAIVQNVQWSLVPFWPFGRVGSDFSEG